MSNYITLTAPTGEELKLDFRPNRYLLIMTSFNPIEKLTFLDCYLAILESVEYPEAAHRYEDGTGYYILKLKTGYDKQTVITELTSEFEEYFGFKDEAVQYVESIKEFKQAKLN